MKRIILMAFALLCLLSPAEARHRHRAVIQAECFIFCAAPVKAVRHVSRMRHVHRVAHVYRSHRRHYAAASTGLSIPGIVRSASGATAHVAAGATGAFQCLVSALESAGYPIRFMGGWRAHGSVRGSLHPAGLALDVNQIRRNVTTPRMPSNEISLASGCGLISGAVWRNADSGHFQLGGWAGGHRHYALRHHRNRYASAR